MRVSAVPVAVKLRAAMLHPDVMCSAHSMLCVIMEYDNIHMHAGNLGHEEFTLENIARHNTHFTHQGKSHEHCTAWHAFQIQQCRYNMLLFDLACWVFSVVVICPHDVSDLQHARRTTSHDRHISRHTTHIANELSRLGLCTDASAGTAAATRGRV
jgi:hypothetical protein